MRWLLIVLLVSLAALLFAAAGLAHHIWQQRTRRVNHATETANPQKLWRIQSMS
jgi:hypothetical protein